MRKTGSIILAALAGVAAAPLAAATGNALGFLNRLEPGRWVVASRDGGPSRTVCLGDPIQLIRLRHSSGSCSRYVVEDAADKVTVQYTCKGSGYGRTSVRRETASLVQIESQGIEGGLPFQFRAEARRTGACR